MARGRQLRRMLKEDVSSSIQPGNESDGDECSGGSECVSQENGQTNLFDLLGNGSQSSSSSEEEEEQEEQEEENDGGAVVVPIETKDTSYNNPNNNSKSRKQVKRDGKACKKDQLASVEKEEEEEEDLDAILREMAMHDEDISREMASSKSLLGSEAIKRSTNDILRIDVKRLQAQCELRRMFGSDATTTSRLGDDGLSGSGGRSVNVLQGASRRVRRLAARGLLRQKTMKPGICIKPRDTWPFLSVVGLVLSQQGVGARGSKVVFSYSASVEYEQVQEVYRQVQESFNPEHLVSLIRAHPYHIDALLTMSDLYRSTGDAAYADEMLEQCVYALERGWPRSLINLLQSGDPVEVPYSGYNTSLYIALGRYVQILGRRGLHRTALECCKLVLALNKDDPRGILLTIDYYALRCGDYDFLKVFAERYNEGALNTMPSIVYSLALASFLENNDGSTQQREVTSVDVQSQNALAKAIMMHPHVLVALCKRLGYAENSCTDSRMWHQMLNSGPLVASPNKSASLEKLIDIFVERQHLLWKPQAVQEWVFKAALRVFHASAHGPEEQAQELPFGLTIQDWATVREQAWPESTEDEYAHLKVQDFSDTISQLPAEAIHGLDPGEPVAIADQQQLEGLVRQDTHALDDAHPLAAFLRSLLPWVNAGQQPEYDDDGGGGGNDDGEENQPDDAR
eukprot:jgi/Picsp_1/1226/NSC_04707-R1_transcription factor